MEKIEFARGIKILQSCYSRDFTEDDLKIWYMQFKYEEGEIFYKAINKIIRTEKYMPSIAEILNEMKLIEMPELTLDGEIEFENVRKAIRKYGSYRQKELMESLKPETARAVRQVGLQRICECNQDKLKFIKDEFIDILENNKCHSKEEYISGTNTELIDMIRKETNKKLLDNYLD